MKKTKILLMTLFVTFMLTGMLSNAIALTINLNTTTLIVGEDASNAVIKAAVEPWVGDADEFLYDAGPTSGESGPLVGSYETTFSATGQIEVALVGYTGGNIVGTPAYLIAKDGKNGDPTATPPIHAWYLYDLTALGWNGTDSITIEGLWPNQGSFSHISMYGTNTQVPEPTTMLLLGLGLVGLAGVGRKLKK